MSKNQKLRAWISCKISTNYWQIIDIPERTIKIITIKFIRIFFGKTSRLFSHLTKKSFNKANPIKFFISALPGDESKTHAFFWVWPKVKKFYRIKSIPLSYTIPKSISHSVLKEIESQLVLKQHITSHKRWITLLEDIVSNFLICGRLVNVAVELMHSVGFDFTDKFSEFTRPTGDSKTIWSS